ncbi:MAG: glycosyltransferase [Bacteroidota bacterium]
MDLAYAAADVVVGRAGALTISELCLVGKPVVLVPSPNVAEDHQTKNAQALAERNAAVLLPDRVAQEGILQVPLDILGDEKRAKELGQQILELAKPNAAETIAAAVLDLANQKR